MKHITINNYQIGLAFKNSEYQHLLQPGKYWLWNKDVKIYDTTLPFTAPVELNILLQDAELANALQIVEVRDNEIALQFENGLLKQVLTAGRYAFWKSVMQLEFVHADISKVEIDAAIDRNLLLHKLLAP